MGSVVKLQPLICEEVNLLSGEIRDRLVVCHANRHPNESEFRLYNEGQWLIRCAMYLVLWTIGRRAVAAGEITEEQRRDQFAIPDDRLLNSQDVRATNGLPHEFSKLMGRSAALLGRCQRLDTVPRPPGNTPFAVGDKEPRKHRYFMDGKRKGSLARPWKPRVRARRINIGGSVDVPPRGSLL